MSLDYSTFMACAVAELVLIIFLIIMIALIILRFRRLRKELLNERENSRASRKSWRIATSDRC